MAPPPQEDDEATVRAPVESAPPKPAAPSPAPVDDEATRVETAAAPAPARPAPPPAFVAERNDVDPEATNLKPIAEQAEATTVDRPRRPPRPSLPARLARRFTGEHKRAGPSQKPGFLYLSTMVVLTLTLLLAVFQLTRWALRSGDEGAAAAARPAGEERSVLDRLINW